ncbi:hypothetical protein SKAU_G00298220 [Synaphobranchus kaupii]|uniref:Uncharacterized protein n=1 Tax=Synaphobranchus kaupii TaxID=118154 RepID=A0A9Q1IMS4_SYNKA|nr:hypothetical protein SKAU_G00298220 [Synaphobranchus kaupii]
MHPIRTGDPTRPGLSEETASFLFSAVSLCEDRRSASRCVETSPNADPASPSNPLLLSLAGISGAFPTNHRQDATAVIPRRHIWSLRNILRF